MRDTRWSAERANAWYAELPWLVGCNFIPSTAINQLEMWQGETFDPDTINRELGWAAELGFNSVRVYLHDLVWEADPEGFKSRIDRYLELATSYGISTVLVLFDDCWNPDPRPGRQPAPKSGVHNSGWMESPGIAIVKNPQKWDRLEAYVKGIVEAFDSDERVLMWDIYNEPGNYFMPTLWLPAYRRVPKLLYLLFVHLFFSIPTVPLLKQAFAWARAVQPTQPLTAALWYILPTLPSRVNEVMRGLSDVITFHFYHNLETTCRVIDQLEAYGRPLICTEYLSRGTGNLFETHLPVFKEHKIGCYNWGLVGGKTQTFYRAEDASHITGGEPTLWNTDILQEDGTPYRAEEVKMIRRLTDRSAPQKC